MLRHLIVTVFATITVMASTLPSLAQSIPAPTGEVVLTISGEIEITNVGDTLQFDRETLSALGTYQIETSTNWTERVHTFEGVSLYALTQFLGISEGTLHATAINDYSVEIPVSDGHPNGPIIAHTQDGAQMSIREKGPLWIVYPYDTDAKYRTDVIYSRSIWQLDRINVVK